MATDQPVKTAQKSSQISHRVRRHSIDGGVAAAIVTIAAYYFNIPAELTPAFTLIVGFVAAVGFEYIRPNERRRTVIDEFGQEDQYSLQGDQDNKEDQNDN